MASRIQSTKDGAGYTCDFVEQSLNLFNCEVCKLVLRYPQITQCCGKNACRSCIEKEAKNGAPCPISGCQNRCVVIIFNRDLHHDILRSKVYCSSRENGCEWVDTLENLEKHLRECPFLEEECQNSCGMKIQRRMVKEHKAVCERFSVKCEQCGNLYERKDQSSHLDACSHRMVKCPFNIVGCTAEVLSKDLQQHFDESLSEHYALVAKQSQDLQAKIQDSDLPIQVKENLKPLLARQVEIVEINGEVLVAEREIIELQRALKEAQLGFNELYQRYSQVFTELQQLIREKEASICVIREQSDQLVITSKVRCYGPALPHIHPADIVSRPLYNPETSEEYISRVTFAIPRFQEERENDTCLYLPPFYSHRGGYKMCLVVYCNGFRGAKGNSVSVEPRVLSGKYDENLEWPLHCNIEIEIEGVLQLKKTISINSKSPTPGERFVSPSLGSCQHIIRLGSLMGYRPLSSYLTDGCLTIHVTEVMFNQYK